MKLNYKSLRNKYPCFIYKDYFWEIKANKIKVGFSFEIPPDIFFNPTIVIASNTPINKSKIDIKVMDNLVFNLGLAEIPSYWKSTCSKDIVIEAGKMTEDQIYWWENFLLTEMSQYYFENSIDFTAKDFIRIKSAGKKSHVKIANVKEGRTLVPVGGGKDSSLTLELLSREKIPFSSLIVNPIPSSQGTVKLSSSQGTIEVRREIDSCLIKLNNLGFLNGHTPIVAYISFLSILVAYLYGFHDVIFSNESSADEGNAFYKGSSVNHQHDKSYEFESSFRGYNKKYLSNINYFSLLRPIGELKISEMFAKYANKYFSSFISCNIGQKKNRWCLKCPKCLSTYVLLFPFLKEKVNEIFKEDMFQDISLKTILENMILPDREKPLECVATKAEIISALLLSEKVVQDISGYPLLKYALVLIKREGLNQVDPNKILENYSKNNFLQGRYKEILRKYL